MDAAATNALPHSLVDCVSGIACVRCRSKHDVRRFLNCPEDEPANHAVQEFKSGRVVTSF